jgi:hypothetical protein
VRCPFLYVLVREVIPHTPIVIDHYHVVKTVNTPLENVRKRVHRHLKRHPIEQISQLFLRFPLTKERGEVIIEPNGGLSF